MEGLSTTEVKALLEKYGRNEIKEKQSFSALSVFISQFPSLINGILFVASVLSFLIGETKDAFFIIAILFLNGTFGFIQEYRAQKALEKLKQIIKPTCRVIRDGKEQEIATSDLVPGDVLILSEGDRVPADGTVLKSTNLEVDESILTGESLPVLKQLNGEVFSGTLIVKGRAYVKTAKTGQETRFGKIAQSLKEIKADKTPLEKRLSGLAKVITVAVVLTATLLIPFGFLRGDSLYPVLLLAISVAVAAIPEGLPAVLTIALAIGTSRMAKAGAIVRRMVAVETLGSVQIILTDKTGTLTQNRMQVKETFLTNESALLDIVESCVLNNTASLVENTNSEIEAVGEQTDGSLLLWASQKADIEKVKSDNKLVSEFLFDPQTRTITTIAEKEGKLKVIVRGSPEYLIENSRLTDGEKEKLKAKIEQFGSKGLRVIGFGSKYIKSNSEDRKDLEQDLNFLGIIGIYDAPRKDVKEAVESAKKAGIKTIMVTGDNRITALAIAKEVGLADENGEIITGDVLDKLSDKELEEIITKTSIFARVEPHQKLRLVEALKSKGYVVGVTGDGINDSLALKKADVGIAMGSGTDVAKEASDIVLTDDNYATIVKAVEQGRRIYDNILKAITYLLTHNLSEISLIVFATVLNFPLPLLPTQILWMNLVSDGLPALALAADRKNQGILEKAPRNPATPILTRERVTFILSIGIGVAVLFLILFNFLLSIFSEVVARTILFNLFVFSHLTIAFIVRGKLLFRGNNFLIFAVLFTIAIQVVITFTPFFQEIFQIGFK